MSFSAKRTKENTQLKVGTVAIDLSNYRCYVGKVSCFYDGMRVWTQRCNIKRILLEDALNDAKELQQEFLAMNGWKHVEAV